MTALHEPTIAAVLDDLHRRAERNDDEVMPHVLSAAEDRGSTTDAELADLLADAYMPIDRSNGELVHALAVARRPGRIVEFGTSMGLSTIYLAAALAPDEPPLIASEIEPHKVEAARDNLARAGLAGRVELREGDAFETLADLTDPASLLFLDGWKQMYLPMLELLEPLLVDGTIVVADDTTLLPDLCRPYLDYVRSPESGYASAPIPFGDGIEISVLRPR